MKTLQETHKEIGKILDYFGLYHNIMHDQLSLLFITSLKELLEQVVVEKREQLDKNDPDNYGACYAIGGWNHCRQEVEDRIKKILE